MPPKKASAAKQDAADDHAHPASPIPECFKNKDFYEVLGVAKTATVEEISKAYKGLSLKHHPDRNQSATATEEFQYLARIHETLAKDPRRRELYDKHGDAALTDASEGFFDAYEYWRSVFPTLSTSDVDAFEVTYVGSADEREDTQSAWNECKGDFAKMMTSFLLFASSASLPRHTALVREMIADGSLDKKHVPAFEKSLKTVAQKLKKFEDEEEAKKKAEEEEAKEAAATGKKPKKAGPDMAALMQMLMSQKGGKESLFDSIAAKFGAAAGKKKGAKKAGGRKAAAAAAEGDDDDEQQDGGDDDDDDEEEEPVARAPRKKSAAGAGAGAGGRAGKQGPVKRVSLSGLASLKKK